MKTQQENPHGLHKKYHVQKIVQDGTDFFGNANYIYQDAPKDAEYFVLRLDDNQKDKIHREACITAILTYADAIKDHLPELSNDLITKYQPNNTI